MPNTGNPEFDKLPDLRHRVLARGRRIARPVGQEHAIGLALQDVLGADLGRHHCHLAAGRRQAAQDVALQAVIHGDHVQLRLLLPAVALAPQPARLVPGVALAGGDLGHQVHALEPRPRPGLAQQPIQVERAGRLVGDHPVGHAFLADAGDQGARIDPRQGDDAARLEPAVERLRRPVVGGLRDRRAQHAAAHARAHGEIGGLGVLGVGADVADVREGKRDDLAGVGRVGQDLLVAGDRRIEAHLAHRRAGGAEPLPADHRAVGQHQPAGEGRVSPGLGGIPVHVLVSCWDFRH